MIASIRGRHLSRNVIIDSHHESNRDNCFDPYVKLQEKFKQFGISLNTSDINFSKDVAFEIHHDVQSYLSGSHNYLLLLESEYTCPANSNLKNISKYRKVFTWKGDYLEDPNYIRIYLPNPILVPSADGWSYRDIFCCMIAGNKSLSMVDLKDLYVERINTIRWFERNAPTDFKLYGSDWDLPAIGRGKLGKITRKVFPSYEGSVSQKKEVYLRSRFSICYENVRDVPGYITEKIFDSFFSGCVPVYWGASDITKLIPKDCFIDRRDFQDNESLYNYMKSIDELEYINYQSKIALFLKSDKANLFSSEFFANTIVKVITDDLTLEQI